MSQGNAAARKRRAGGASLQEVGNPVPASVAASAPKAGLTLPQVISLVDKRLVTLETFMKETQNNGFDRGVEPQQGHVSEGAINGLSDEINAKFEMLANEVGELKDIVLKLQSYTMEVNKTLFEERIQMLSDMDVPPNSSSSSSNQVQPEVYAGHHDNIVFDLSEDGDNHQ
jgi:hypothetical protein